MATCELCCQLGRLFTRRCQNRTSGAGKRRAPLPVRASFPEGPYPSCLVVMMVPLLMVVRTGRILGLSAAWFPMMPATGLAQNQAAPEVAGKLCQFLWQRHGLIEVSEEIVERRAFSHDSPHQ